MTRILTLTALFAAAVPALDAQQMLLRMTPAEGSVVRYKADAKVWVVSVAIPTPDPSQPMMSMVGYITQTVDAVGGDTVHITAMVDSANIGLPAAMGAAGMPDLSGMRMSMTLDTRGRILQSGVDPNTLPAQLRGAESMLQQNFGGVSLNLPEGPISPGDTWTFDHNDEIANFGGTLDMETHTEYRLESIDGSGGNRVAIISASGTVSQQTQQDGDTPPMMNISLNGSMTGEFVIDLGRGIIVSATNNTNLEGELTMAQAGQSFPMQVTSEILLTLMD
ncbi:MAG: DUF6263 family protein [Gemmatimonadales bacterium]